MIQILVEFVPFELIPETIHVYTYVYNNHYGKLVSDWVFFNDIMEYFRQRTTSMLPDYDF
jgi:CRISPR/Cas system Type II protein with McrA/HNH and RuvC-like nuclease domain